LSSMPHVIGKRCGRSHAGGRSILPHPKSCNGTLYLHDGNRGLWIPNLREGSSSLLKTLPKFSGICPSRRLQTQRLRHCGLSATSRIPLPPCADGLSPSSSPFSRAARAAERKQRVVHVVIYDTVVLDAEAVIPLNGKLGRYRPPSSKVCD